MISLLQDTIEKISAHFQHLTVDIKKPFTVEMQGIKVEFGKLLRDDRPYPTVFTLDKSRW